MAAAESSPVRGSESSHTTGSEQKPADAEIAEKQLSGHRARYAKVFGFFGFTKAYNFPLWVIFAGAMLGFSISRLPDYNFDIFAPNIGPGLLYIYSSGYFRVCIFLHLGAALPAGVLMVLQFTPVIRHKAITFHRMNGYLILFLLFVSNAAVSAVLHHNEGGNRIAAQTSEAFLVVITTVGMSLAWWNIKRLQIDLHRAWMLRTMFYYGSIITSRIFASPGMYVVGALGGYYEVQSCAEIAATFSEFGLGGIPPDTYPLCFAPNATGSTMVPVLAVADPNSPAAAGASYNAPFGSMLWIAIVLHIIGVEIYLQLTPAESHRLRRISYERQLEAGYKDPGNAGTTVAKWGDPVVESA